MTRLLNILEAEGRRLLEEFKLASEQGEGTAQEIADFRENAVQQFISRFYPASHVISKGKVTDLEGNQSNSIDCLILNPAHPKFVDAWGKFRLIFADGCDAAIEVKPDLARCDELYRVLGQCISIKQRKRSEAPVWRPQATPSHILMHSLHIPFFVLSARAFDPSTLYRRISEYYIQNNITIEEQVDAIFIINSGIVSNCKHKERNQWVAGQDGWYFEQWGEATPVGVLLHLGHSFASYPRVTNPITNRVLLKLGKGIGITRLGDRIQ